MLLSVLPDRLIASVTHRAALLLADAAQVRAAFGATAAQQRAVGAWLAHSGLAVTHRDPFVVSATGTAAQAEAATAATLELTRLQAEVTRARR